METKNDNKSHPLPKYAKPYMTVTLILGSVIMLIVGGALLWVSFEKANLLQYYIIREIGKAVILTVLVSTVINWYFNKQLSVVEKEKQESERRHQEEKEKYEREKDELFRQDVNKQLDTLREGVLSQTKEIANQAVCFDALQSADVDRFFGTRDESSENITTVRL